MIVAKVDTQMIVKFNKTFQDSSFNPIRGILTFLCQSVFKRFIKQSGKKNEDTLNDPLFDVFSIHDSEDLEFISDSRLRSNKYSVKQQKAQNSPSDAQERDQNQITSFDVGEEEKQVSLVDKYGDSFSDSSKELYLDSNENLLLSPNKQPEYSNSGTYHPHLGFDSPFSHQVF